MFPKKRLHIMILLALLLATMSSCQSAPTSPNNQSPTLTMIGGDAQNIQVETVSPQKTAGHTEDFPLPNCGGTGKLTQFLGAQVSVSKTVDMGATVSVSGGAEVGVSAAAKIAVEAAIEAAYRQAYETANSRLDTIGMEAAPKTHVVYTVQWETQEFSSIVTFEFNRELVQTPYTFTMNIPKLAGSREEQCADIGSVIAVTGTTDPLIIVQPQSIDLTCQGREINATINGKLVPLSSWQADCSYYKVLNGENIILSTWGVILIYNSSITGSVIIQPNISYVAPNNSVLFAGYINKASLLRAYEARNPNAPTPSP